MNTVKKVFTVGVVFTTILWAVGFAAFVPVANATSYSAGDLIKASGDAVYYYASDGKRYVFPNQTTYMSWYSDFSEVKTISDDELASISIGGNATMRPGTNLVKITTDPKVYAVTEGGTLHWVETEELANTLYGPDWADRIVDVPDSFFVNYTTGDSIDSAVHPDGTLIQYEGSPDIYLIEDGEKRMIEDESAFMANNFQWDFITPCSDTVTYGNGPDVTGEESDLTAVAGEGVTPGAAGTLTVSLASDTPASGNVAKGANTNYTKVTLTAGASDVEVDKLYVTRYGLSGNADVENVKLVDTDGVQWGNTAGNLNSNGVATLTFTNPLEVSANTSVDYYLRAGVPAAGSTTGNTVALGIASADDVDTDASVSGSFPVQGNEMEIVGTTIGSVSVAQDGTVTDVTPDAGDEDVVLNKFKVTAGSTEGVTIENLTLLESGSASLSDTANIELWSVTDNESLGELSGWNSEGKAAFTGLDIDIDKGDTHRFKVMVDIVSGAGLTVNADLTDGGDVLMTAKGQDYGFYLTPTVSGGWNGQGANNQTINTGSLTISRSTSSPATGNITEADDQQLTVFDFEAKGEEVTITSTQVDFTLGGQADGADFINCVLRDEEGDVVAGPQDSTDASDTVTFSDTYIVPVGVNEYSFECTVYDSDADDWGGGSNDTVIAGIAAAANVTAKGFTTNTSITPGGSYAVNGNTQTIKFGTLAATTLTTPAARSVVPGAQDLMWMTGSLSAANSGEDMIVETVIIEDNFTDNSGGTDGISVIDNMELWADLDNNGSYETKISDTQNPTTTGGTATYTQTFTLDPTVTVPKDDYVKIALYADLASSAGATDVHQLRMDLVAGGVVASGDDTGTSVNVTPSGNGQNFTVAANGALTVSVDSSSPNDYGGTQDHLLEGNASKQTLGVFRLTETSQAEDLELDSFKVTDDGAGTLVDTWYLYASERADGGSTSDPVATAVGTGSVTFYVNDGVVKVPADSYILLTVKGDVKAVDGTTVSEEDDVEATVDDDSTDVVTTGLSSGQTVNGAAATNYDAATFVGLSSVPSVAYADGWTDDYSKTLVQGSSSQIAKIAVTAGSRDITFENGNATVMFSLQVTGSASGGDAGNENVVFKDGEGNILETVAAEIDNGVVTTQVDCTFATTSWTIPANTTEHLYVYADTTGYTTTGDTLQTWLDDTAADVDFSIDLDSANYQYGDILNRGDRYGATFSK